MNSMSFNMDDAKVYIGDVEPATQSPCPTCGEGYALVTDGTNDCGITLCYTSGSGWGIMAYGYNTHSSGSSKLLAPINFCPTCGRILRSFQEIRENRHKS